MSGMKTLTQDELKELLSYDPETGIFIRRVRAGRVPAGAVAGWLTDSGYREVSVNGTRYRTHRLAFLYMVGQFPPQEVDHINGHRDDNRWSNLRPVTHTENMRNTAMSARNTSGICGVGWIAGGHCWGAGVRIRGRYIHLGCFKTLAEAAAARRAADRAYGFTERHGERLAA
jgi:hypothetical protein